MYYKIGSIIIIFLVICVFILTYIDNKRYEDDSVLIENLYSGVEEYQKQKIQREEIEKLIKESKLERLDVEILIYKLNKELEE